MVFVGIKASKHYPVTSTELISIRILWEWEVPRFAARQHLLGPLSAHSSDVVVGREICASEGSSRERAGAVALGETGDRHRKPSLDRLSLVSLPVGCNDGISEHFPRDGTNKITPAYIV